MWSKLTYQKKLKLLAVAALLLLLICYRFSIANTVAEYRLYRANKLAAAASTNTNSSDEPWEKKDQRLNNLLDQYALDTTDNSKNLLSIVGNYCNRHDLILKEYKPFNNANADTMRVLTRTVSVEGRFVDCLRLVYELETKHKAGKVNAVYFKSYVDPRTTVSYLQCTLYVQNLINAFYDKQ